MTLPSSLRKIKNKKIEAAKNTLKGDSLKNQAIASVMENADGTWLQLALDAIFRVASREDAFTVDSVWLLDEGLPSPREPRAMGAAMKIAERAGWITPTRDHWLSKRPVCHRRPLRVWQSQLLGLDNNKTKGRE